MILRGNTVDFEQRPDGICIKCRYVGRPVFRLLRSSGIWFEITERQETASCVGSRVSYAGIIKYLFRFDRRGSNPVMVAVSGHSRCILTSGISGPKLSDAKKAHHRFAIK